VLREVKNIRKTRFIRILVATLLILSSLSPPSVGEAAWVRRRQGQVTPQFWVDTSRYVSREVVVTPARTIPATTERRWVVTTAARPAEGRWETIERRWVEVTPAVPAQYETREVVATEQRWTLVAMAMPARPAVWGWVYVGYVGEHMDPEDFQYLSPEARDRLGDPIHEWREISPAVPAQPEVWRWVTVPAQGRWENTTWIPPVTENRWVQISPATTAQPAVWGWVYVGYVGEHMDPEDFQHMSPEARDRLGDPIHEWRETSPAVPARSAVWGWRTVEVVPGRWEQRWVPPATTLQTVRVAEAIPARHEFREFVVTTSQTAPATEWRWVQTAPAVVAQAAQWAWRYFEVAPGRWENTWIPPRTQTRLVEVAPARPAVYNTTVTTVQPGRWETTWIPPVTAVRRVQVSPGIPPIHETREVVVSPGRWENTVSPPVTETRTVMVSPAMPAVYQTLTFQQPSEWRWVQTSPGVPARYSTTSVVVVPGRTIPAVTTRRWVVTSPAQPAQPAQGGWETVEIAPARRVRRTVITHRWVDSVHGDSAANFPGHHADPSFGGSGGTNTTTTWGLWETTVEEFWDEVPAVTATRWVQTSPPVPAQAAQGYWETVEISPAQWIPPVVNYVTTRVSEAIPAQGTWRDVPGAITTQTIEVSPARDAVFSTQTVVVTPGRTESTWVPPVTATQTVQISPGAPAQYQNEEVLVSPGRWENAWLPPVTAIEREQVSPAVPAVFEAVEETIPGRWEASWVPPVTESRWVEVSPAVAGQAAQGHFEAVVPDPNLRTTRWVETAPAVAAGGEWQDVVVFPAVNLPAVTRVETEWSESGYFESLEGTITVERDREYVLTQRWRASHRTHDMGITLTYQLNREVVGVHAVHVLDRYQGMGQLFIPPVSRGSQPGRTVLNFNYEHPGQITSTLFITLHFAGGESFQFEMQIPVNGIVVTQRSGEGLELVRAAARVGTITIP